MNKFILALFTLLFIGSGINKTNAQMNKIPQIELSNGRTMPQLGVGTFLVKDAARVSHAIKTGYLLTRLKVMATRMKWVKEYA